MFLPAPSDFDWMSPWEPEEDGAGLVQELQKELSPGHELFGITVLAVGRRLDNDDVLFVTGDASKPLVVVHLTWKRENNPKWPWTEPYQSWQDWIERRMLPDHRDERADF